MRKNKYGCPIHSTYVYYCWSYTHQISFAVSNFKLKYNNDTMDKDLKVYSVSVS